MKAVSNRFTLLLLFSILTVCVFVILDVSFRRVFQAPKMINEFPKPVFETPKYNFLVASEPKLYVSTSPRGRLGNNMFQYASLMGIANLNNGSHQPFYLGKQRLPQVFQVTRIGNMNTTYEYECAVQKEIGSCTFDRRFENLPMNNSCVRGFLQSWKYFVDIEDFIRKEFTLLPAVKLFAQEMLSNLTKGRQKATKIGIHIRRGDYVEPRRKGKFQLPPMTYFLKAALYFRRKYPDAIFIVVTTGRKWCQPLLEMEDFVMAAPASPGHHMALLTLCDHVIMSIGSYGWWGAFLAGGDVVYYKNLVYPKPTSKRGFIHADFFPPEWVGISD